MTRAQSFLLKILMLVKGCIEKRAVEDKIEDGGSSNTHLLDDVHTHIGIGVFMMEDQLRYVEVRYLRLALVTMHAGTVDIPSGCIRNQHIRYGDYYLRSAVNGLRGMHRCV